MEHITESEKEKIRLLLGLNPEAPTFEKLAKGFLANLDSELCQKKILRDGQGHDGETCQYEPVLNRPTIENALGRLKDVFAELVESEVSPEIDKVLLQKQVRESLDQFHRHFNKWLDNDSPMGNLEAYFETLTISPVAQRSIRGLANAYLRYTHFEPDFTEKEARGFLRTRKTKSTSRKTYGAYLRTFFKAQGISRESLPFQYDRIKILDNERPIRRTYPFERVIEFISHIKHSDSARAGFYGSLVTVWGYRPIEMSRLSSDNIDRDNHIITLQTAKHGLIRTHYIPEAIRPYIYGYDVEPIPDKSMYYLWQYIIRDIGWSPREGATGRKAYAGYGWYGIRHSLITNLINKSQVHPQRLERWMGWRTGQASGAKMSNVYYEPSVGDMKLIDETILANHPFLPYWENNSNKAGKVERQDEVISSKSALHQ